MKRNPQAVLVALETLKRRQTHTTWSLPRLSNPKIQIENRVYLHGCCFLVCLVKEDIDQTIISYFFYIIDGAFSATG